MSLMNNLTDGILKCLEEDRKFNFTNELCNHIYDKKISLKKICEICGPYLTSSDRVKRLKAMDFLFNLVLNIKPNGFTDSEVNYLIEFFTGRLTDSFLIQCEISQTIHLLVTKWNIEDDKIKGLCFAIKKVEVSQQSSEIRFQFYKILGHILKHRLSFVKSMNTEFIFLFLQSADGEKDPRCLLLVFDLFVFLNQHLDTSSYEEELFELVACYFPIMYNPPKEINKLHITKEDLSERLLACITCNKKFTPYLLQLLIDKFESPLEEIKIYCYQALNQISIDGDYRIFAKYMPEFWNFIKFDLLKKRSKSNFEITNHAENCLRLLTKVFSGDDELIKRWFKMILADLEACLFNLELNCYLPSTVTLSILGLSYAKYFNTICRLLISNSIHNYNLSEETRTEAMQSLSLFADEMQKEKQLQFSNQEFIDHHLLLSKISLEKIEILDKYETIPTLFDHLICYQFNLVLDTDSNFLECLIPLRKLLSLDLGFDKETSTKHLNELIELLISLQNSYLIDKESIIESNKFKEAIKIIENLSRLKGDLVQEIFIPYTLNNLKTNNELLIKVLNVCPLNLQQENLLIDYALDCLKSNETKVNSELVCTLKSQIRRNQTKQFVDLFCDKLMQPLVELVLQKNDEKSFADKELVFDLINEICKYLDDEKATQVQNFIFIMFTCESSEQVPKNCFLNFQYKLNGNLFLRLMESMIRSLKINNDDKDQLKLVYCKLFDKLMTTKDQPTLQLLIDLIEICTVKFENTKAIIGSLKYLNDVYEDQESRIRYLLVRFYVAIIKSYLTIGKDDSQAIIKKLVQVLIKDKNLEICKHAIEGIKYIHELDSKFSAENHCKCKSFLNQRFYHQITPLLIKEYNNLDSENALNDLTIIEKEYVKFMEEEPETNQTKKIYSRKNTDSYVETMITSIESKIEKENENSPTKSTSENDKKIKVLQISDVDSAKQSLNLRKNLISNAIFLQISYLPKPMIKVELKRLQKIIAQHSLNLDVLSGCDVLISNQVEFVKLILEFNSKLLEDKIVNLVNSLIEILTLEESNMHVKCKILNCLELIATRLNPVELIKFKVDIINQIKKLLDHRKRLVRYAAVSSINHWIVLGQPI